MVRVFFLFCVASAHAVTLSLPNKFNSGTLSVRWTRSNGDPTSFGLLQRSLLGNNPIISVTPVDNEEGATSGTVSVLFETAGQVLLTPIAQLSLSTGETPNQLNAGSQLTVIPVSDVEVTLPSTPTSRSRTQASTSATQRLIAQPSTAQPSTATPGGSSRTALGASAASNTGFPRASSSISSFPQSLSSSVPASPSSASSTLSFTLSPGSTQSAPSFSESAVPRADHAKSGPPRGTIIAVAVVIPVVVLVAVLFCIIRTQRTSTQHRIDRFTEVWSRRRTTIGAATISSFGTPATAEEGLNAESDWVATGQPVSAPETRRDDAATSSMSAAIQQQKLQFMVAELTARNAVLEQQASALSSRPYSLGMTENSELPPEYATVE